MIATSLPRLALLCGVAMVSACTALELRDANQQLVTYYMAKQDALTAKKQASANGNRDGFAIVDGVRDSFSRLGEQAFAQAGTEKDPLNRIAFYRIATTAAWQAQDGKAGYYAVEGNRLCEAGNAARAPTDCALLMLMPTLASVDAETRKLAQLNRRASEPGFAPSDTDRQQAEAIYGAYSDAFTRLITQREAALKAPVSETFVDALDANIERLLCQHIARSALGALGNLKSTTGRMEAASVEVSEMKCTAIAAKINPSKADCLVSRPVLCP